MLAKRVIPTVLCSGRQAMKGVGFNAARGVGLAAQAMKVHGKRQVDELCLLDITATAEGRGPDLSLVRELSEAIFVPLTVGGGVRSLQDIDALLRAGADKVAICTAAGEMPTFIHEAASRFGRQAIVVSVDYTMVSDPEWSADRPCVSFHCGKTAFVLQNDDGHTPMHPVEYAARMESFGAGEILLQCIDRDGTMTGYDLDLIREVSAATSIPVIASGGARDYADMLAAIHAGADAVAAGAMFAFTDATPRAAAKFLREHGVAVRL